MNRADCISLLRQAGRSESEAADMVDALLEEKARVRAAGGNIQQLSAQWSERAQRFARDVQRQEYLKALNLLRYSERAADVDRFIAAGHTYKDAIQSIMVGQNKFGEGSRDSVSALREGIRKSYLVPLADALDKIEGAGELLRNDKDFHRSVFRELWDVDTGDSKAKEVAKVFRAVSEQAREDANRYGANIGHVEHWTPQSHDPYKMMDSSGQAREEWGKYIYDLIDWDKTMPELQTKDERMQALIGMDHKSVYSHITLGKLNGIFDELPHEPPRVRAKASSNLEHSRVIHFKDADSALAYHEKYGKGNILDSMVSHLEYSARATALLQRLGPSPRQVVNKLVNKAIFELEQQQGLRPQAELKKEIDSLRSWNRPGGGLDDYYKELTGEINIPGNELLARVGSIARSIESMAKLGGATLSAIADPFIAATSKRYMGESWWEALYDSVSSYFKGLPKGQEKEIARQGGAFLDTLVQEIASRYEDNFALPSGWSGVMNKFFRLSGLNWITETGKSAHTLWLAGRLGEVSHLSLDQMDKNISATLKYHGITPDRWDVMRKMVQEVNGKKYFTPQGVRNLTDDDLAPLLRDKYKNPPQSQDPTVLEKWNRGRQRNLQEVRDSLEWESRGMMIDETKMAIIEPDDYSRSWMRQGFHPGTGMGELLRSIMQFKAFPITYMQRVLGGRRWIRGERQETAARSIKGSLTADVPGVVGFALGAVAFGYVSSMLKDLSKGRTPRDPRKPETWFAALVQSGGAGIMGDIAFGTVNRFGGSALESLAGPIPSAVAGTGGLLGIPASAFRGDVGQVGHDLFRFTQNNMPFLNLWYTRAAFDYLVGYQIRESMSRGSLRKMQRKLKEDFNQEYLFAPTKYRVRWGQ